MGLTAVPFFLLSRKRHDVGDVGDAGDRSILRIIRPLIKGCEYGWEW